ncbi:hypothetical protein GCM10023084_19620 [Streptomyces lacrimifluminis]|uniref:Uncharacterized protein n=1 Tax=Streptomyces lacrimifluminis TaxID=1500077 RepID=A0A917KI19_9ACTN|nr:hypothetical protein [Streptomyces lacrimifluminis]GGJ10628.1 hypothetical protein GCM10012282_03990 [Streptomyces lacrimifluminis]
MPKISRVELTSDQEREVRERLRGLGVVTAAFGAIETDLPRALDLARNCHAVYLAADPQLRRLATRRFSPTP